MGEKIRVYKEGEVIESSATQEDENGQIISEVTCRWYGYDRDTANMGTNSLIDAVQAIVAEWDKAKKGGGNAPPKR